MGGSVRGGLTGVPWRVCVGFPRTGRRVVEVEVRESLGLWESPETDSRDHGRTTGTHRTGPLE